MLFNKHLVALLVSGLAVVAAADAQAAVTNYTINFSGGSPNPTAGSFGYDSSTGAFSAFTVNWNGLAFDLTSAANEANPNMEVCTGYFNYLSGACGADKLWTTVQDPGTVKFMFGTFNNAFVSLVSGAVAAPPALANTDGAFTISAAVPEPGSAALLAVGGALMALALRRRAGSHPSPDLR